MSNRWPGGLIRKTPVTPAGPFQNGAAPGMWTLAEASFWTKQGLWPIAGNAQLFVEDVFSTWLYTGNGATQTITTGIDLAGNGGMLWIKNRSAATNNIISDTVRGAGNFLQSNASSQQFFNTDNVSALSSTGFSVGVDSNTNGTAGNLYASWTFREAPKFFDVVTYTGNGGSSQTIAHNLGIAPGMILVKRFSSGSANWQVYHRSLGSTKALYLNLTNAESTWIGAWNNTDPTSTNFTVGTGTESNENGIGYVAYLFAHVTASDGIIQCGSVTGTSGTDAVSLGWEPQWLLIRSATSTANWKLVDNMRGFPGTSTADTARLFANSTNAESSSTGEITVNPTGFQGNGNFNTGETYIYVAIRRGPMRTPTLGTSVFSPNLWTSSTGSTITTNFPVDMQISKYMASADSNIVTDRLRGLNSLTTNSNQPILRTNNTDSESNNGSMNYNYDNVRFLVGANYTGSGWALNFRRAPGFFDEVCYTGVASTNTINHNLGVAPELIIIKSRSNAQQWGVMHTFAPTTLSINSLNTDAAAFSSNYATILWATGQPTSTQFALYSGSTSVNTSGATYVAYLFASVPGVSKVGSYTGNGSSQTINCAFTTGARFVLIKRTDSTGDWYVWDSARGIVAGNDPYLALNSSAAQVTSDDSVDTDSTGFVVNQVAASNINVNAATYIFLAIA